MAPNAIWPMAARVYRTSSTNALPPGILSLVRYSTEIYMKKTYSTPLVSASEVVRSTETGLLTQVTREVNTKQFTIA
jgi:hypothetical protein